jgi:hypothetical protein
MKMININFARRVLLPLPARNERGEGRGEGLFIKWFISKTHLLTPALSSIAWRKGRTQRRVRYGSELSEISFEDY